MTSRDWRGAVALVLAAGLALGWAGALIVVAVRIDMNGVTTVAGPTILATVGVIIAAGVLTWLRHPSGTVTGDGSGHVLPSVAHLDVLDDD